MFIGNVEIQNPVVLGTDGRRYRPAISFVMQRNGLRSFVYGNGQCKGDFIW